MFIGALTAPAPERLPRTMSVALMVVVFFAAAFVAYVGCEVAYHQRKDRHENRRQR